jgi:hypothetical protein
MYLAHSGKHGNTGLLSKASSLDDAKTRLSSHVGTETEVNEAQIIVLVAEDFSPKALTICDYLNNASGDASFSVECWRYSVFKTEDGLDYFALEQILPPPNVRVAIDEKREAAKARKYARDPVRIEFMNGLLAYLNSKSIPASRTRGASYYCSLSRPGWPDTVKETFSVNSEYPHPVLTVGSTLDYTGDPSAQQVKWVTVWAGKAALEFSDIDSSREKFSPLFGDRLIAVLEQIVPKAAGGTVPQVTS